MVALARMKQVAVIGAGECTSEEYQAAERIGGLLANHHVILFSGGLGGVMEAAAKGAYAQGGITVGIIPGITGEEHLLRICHQDRNWSCKEYPPGPVRRCRNRDRRFLRHSF
jgi:predicted Rossmann-fold nucleotide-binding protein